jgi:hypothetical protein
MPVLRKAPNVSSSKNYGCHSNINQLEAIEQLSIISGVKYCLTNRLLNLEINRLDNLYLAQNKRQVPAGTF